MKERCKLTKSGKQLRRPRKTQNTLLKMRKRTRRRKNPQSNQNSNLRRVKTNLTMKIQRSKSQLKFPQKLTTIG
jgi:hypothetical protein